ncbi:hypothetical protein BZA77DRAFT_317461 [Pyronema omphalodes]|nr:hypothetical protein BZA77DRAFT_317461 [Pyronema omphalodes]
MLLDPRFKVEGLPRLGWKPAYICRAQQHVIRINEQHYTRDPENITDSDNDQNQSNLLALLLAGDDYQIDETELQEAAAASSGMPEEINPFPASSVPSERVFADAGNITTENRNWLMGKTTTAVLLIKSWYGLSEVQDWEIEEHKEVGDSDREYWEE